jgi:hypothetical protein
MKMLLIVFRDSMEDEIQCLLKQLSIKAFTEAQNLRGTGEAGTAFASFEWPGANSMILAAVDDDEAPPIVTGLKAFCERMSRQQHGAKIPLRVFVMPCELVV